MSYLAERYGIQSTVTAPSNSRLQPLLAQLWQIYLTVKASCEAWAGSSTSKTYTRANAVRLQLVQAYSLLHADRVLQSLQALQKITPAQVRICFRTPHGPYQQAEQMVNELALLREALCVV
jgi:hypothetical protein